MRITVPVIIVMAVVTLGCARLRVEGPKEPIKVDISMRLDIYQHVAKDIDAIENIVSGGSKNQASTPDKQSWLTFITPNAYAQEGFGKNVEDAAYRRKDRRPLLLSLEEQGIAGENKSGLVEIRETAKADSKTQELVRQENNDRMVIYQAVAQKNGTSVDEVQKLYAKRLQADAGSGTPIEVLNASTNRYEWQSK